METILIAVGKTTTPYIETGIGEYLKRLRHYLPFSVKYLRDAKNTRSLTMDQQKEAEGAIILAELLPSDMVVLLDEHGDQPTSVEFARGLERCMASGCRRLVFVIGGAYGFSDQVYARADRKLSLSRMTFSHEMVRLFFIEQVYRAMTILRNEPYHHE